MKLTGASQPYITAHKNSQTPWTHEVVIAAERGGSQAQMVIAMLTHQQKVRLPEALTLAAKLNKDKAVNFLIEHYANYFTDENIVQALQSAALENHSEIVAFLSSKIKK